MLSPDEQDLISSTAEGLAKGALAPVHALVRDLAGAGVSEIGEVIGLNIRYLKINRAISLVQRVEERLRPLGLDRRRVGLKLLLSSFESASIEDEDELQDLWATLLASAADRREPDVHPSFPDILRQLTARDARLLMLIATMQIAIRSTVPYEPVKIISIHPRTAECGFDPADAGAFDFYVNAETLIRLRMLEPRDVSEQTINGSGQYGAYIVTNLGWAFLRAVTPPDDFRRITGTGGSAATSHR